MGEELSLRIKHEIKERFQEAEDKLDEASSLINRGAKEEAISLIREAMYHISRVVLEIKPELIKNFIDILKEFELQVVQSGILEAKFNIVRYYIVFQPTSIPFKKDSQKLLKEAKKFFSYIKKNLHL
jgi:uncharacterized protein (UPF0332 family)